MTSPQEVSTDRPRPSGSTARRFSSVTALFFLLVLFTAATFAPVLDNGFVQWDDDVYLTTNQTVQREDGNAVVQVFSEFVSGNYHPLTQITYLIEHRIFGLRPIVYHATNLLLHLANAALCLWLLRLLGIEAPAAFVGALLFAVHPLRVEPVAWVTGRKDLLAALFFLLSLGAYVQHRKTASLRRYLASLGLFAFSLLSKATAVGLPLVLLLCDYRERRAMDRKAWIEKLPYVGLSLAAGLVAIAARHSYQGALQETGLGLWGTIGEGAYRVVWYTLARTVVPTFSWLSPYPPVMGVPAPGLVSLLALAGLAAWIAASFSRTRRLALGAGFFLITLAPSLAVPVVGYSADRFSYLPSVGLAYLAAQGFDWAWRSLSGRQAPRAVACILVAAAAVALGIQARQRCAVWKDSVTLWTDGIALYSRARTGPRNLAMAYTYRAQGLREAGRLQEARADLSRALQIDPTTVEALTERALTYAAREQFEEAFADLGRALEVNPKYLAAYFQRGILRHRLGDSTGALADFDAAVRLNPLDVKALNERGIVRAESGDPAGAVSDFTRVVELAPGSADAVLNRGIARLSAGKPEAALEDFRRALELDPASAAAHFGRSLALRELGDEQGASRAAETARALGYGDESAPAEPRPSP